MNKKILILLTTPLLLTACGNSFSGNSFAYESYSATYEGEFTEETFFVGFENLFTNMQSFATKVATFYTSNNKGNRTKNECLNFNSEGGLTGATYNGRSINAYSVNREQVDEYEVTERCSYFVENGNAKFVVYSSGAAEYSDYIQTGFRSIDYSTYIYTYYDTSMKIVDSKLVMHLALNLKAKVDGTVKVERNADVTLNWIKK